MTKEEVILLLNLQLHPLEGGYFKRTYESQISLGQGVDKRSSLTSIYYLLTSDNPVGYLHKNKSDIVHYFHLGSSARYFLISPKGKIFEKRLGADIKNGDQLQLTVPGGYWKASELLNGDFCLISEAVSPGFDYADNCLATKAMMGVEFPLLDSAVLHLLKP